MPEINESLIRKVAELARLELQEEELREAARSMSEVLKHVEELSQVDTEGVEPLIHGIDGALRMREDEIQEFGVDDKGTPRILTHAPEVVHGGFKVPPIVG